MNGLQKSGSHRHAKAAAVGISTFLCLSAIAYVSEIRGLSDGFGRGIAPVLLAGPVAYLLVWFWRLSDGRLRAVSCVGGALLSLSYVCGTCLHYQNDLFQNPKQEIAWILASAGVCLLTVPLFAFLLAGIGRLSDWWTNHQCSPPEKKETVRRCFFRYWIGIFVCYVPVFLAQWPVNFVYDAKDQLLEVICHGYQNHHPILHTLLMGIPYLIGSRLGSASVGISVYTLFQMMILSLAFARLLCYLAREGAPRAFRLTVFWVCALFPMNSVFSITATKDVLFAAFFLMFFLQVLQACRFEDLLTFRRLFALVGTGVLMILFRRNAIYAVVAAIPFLLAAIKGKKQKITLLAALMGAILLASAGNRALIRLVQAKDEEGVREALSVPTQQLGRVAAYRRDDLDALDPALYSEIVGYFTPGFESQYNPYLSDPMKGAVHVSDWPSFIKLWGRVGLHFPGEYVESVLTNTLGYWYMGDTAYAGAAGDGISIYHRLIGVGEEIVKRDFCPPVNWVLDPLFYRLHYDKVPILGFLFRSSTYFWMMVVFALYMIYRRRYRELFLTAVPVFYFLSCFLGPWVALRYIYCDAVCWPVLALLCLSPGGERGLREPDTKKSGTASQPC